jgi:hypothetical protein
MRHRSKRMIDHWRVARLLVEEHGYEKALSVATDLACNGEQRGALVFKAICECIREWGRERGGEDAVN